MSNANTSSWTSFLRSIASFNGDISSLTAPTFILSPVSQTEYSQYWAEHTDLLVAPSKIGSKDNKDDDVSVARMTAAVRWFISTLRSQYCTRNESMGSEKKPLNPFLGELFVGKWPDTTTDKSVGESILLSEQVSHHPPVTAYAVLNEKNKIQLQGYSGYKAAMTATTIGVKQYGHAILECAEIGETFLCTLPPLHIEGLITASPFVELEGKTYIQSSSGFVAVIEFSGRGYFSGKKNSFKARIYKNTFESAHKENAICTISGQWSGMSYITSGSSTPSSKSGDVFFDALKADPQHLEVKPLEKQHELESRRKWQHVADAIRLGDNEKIHVEKSKVENEQREKRIMEKEAGIAWQTRWFHEVDLLSPDINPDEPSDPMFVLAQSANLSIHNVPSGSVKGDRDGDKPAKHWRFQEELWKDEKEVFI